MLMPLQAMALERVELQGANGRRYIFSVDIAADSESQIRGLMFRTHMPRDQGMLFDFGVERPVSMWMKNTYIPLDMLFIQDDGTIRTIVENTYPESLTPISSDGPVRYVLELNAGSVNRTGVVVGDKMTLKKRNKD